MRSTNNAAAVRQRAQRYRFPFIYMALIVLVGLIYAHTVRFSFVNYDDGSYVYQNPNITAGLSWRGIGWAFTHIHSQNWHPLTSISHMFDCQLFGLWPGGHHLVNALLHAFTVLLLFEFLRRATGSLWASAAVASLFAAHPLHVESVAWISERKDVLSAVFFTLTLLAYLHYAARPSWRRMLLVCLVLTAGLLSKPMLVTTPIVLLLLDYWPLRRSQDYRAKLGEKIPLFLLSLGSSVATLVAQRLAVGGTEQLPLAFRINNALLSYVIYLGQTFWPTRLIPFYVHPEGRLAAWQTISAILILVIITAGAFLLRWRRPYLLVGWLWYLVMLVPVIGLVQVGLQGHADRYTYLPQIGLLVAVIWLLRDVATSGAVARAVFTAGYIVTICTLTILSYRQANHWHDTKSLWSYTLEVSPDNDVAHTGLAGIQLVRGEVDEAMEHYRRALQLRDGNAAAHHGLALALARQRKVDQAILHWQKSLEIRPDDIEARNYLGNALAATGHEEEAINQWEQTLRWDPQNADAANNLAWHLATSPSAMLRNADQALTYAQLAFTSPAGPSPATWRGLAAAYGEKGLFDKAIMAAEEGRRSAKGSKNWLMAAEFDRYLKLLQQGKSLREQSPAGAGIR